jgi:penicillin-binding protein 2
VRTNEFNPDARKTILIAIICVVVVIYIAQLFKLQVLNPDYKAWANSNAFYTRTLYPSRGVMYDRNGKYLVYNQPTYEVMVTVKETQEFDTLAFCRAVDISVERFRQRLAEVKNK